MWSVGIAWLVSGVVADRLQRDLGLQPVLLLVERADTVEGLADAHLGHRLPGVDQPAAEFGGGQDAPLIDFQVAREHRCGEIRPASAIDVEPDVDLLVVAGQSPDRSRTWIWLWKRPLFSSRRCWSAIGALDGGFDEWLAEPEVGGVLDLADAGRAGDVARHGDAADEPAVLGHEGEDHAVAIGLRIGLDVGIAAGGEETVDGGAHVGHAERLVQFSKAGCRGARRGRAAGPSVRTGCCGSSAPRTSGVAPEGGVEKPLSIKVMQGQASRVRTSLMIT